MTGKIFKKNNPKIPFNVFYVKKNDTYPAYISKYNLNKKAN